MSFGDIVQSLKKAVFEGSVESASFSFTANVTAKKKKRKKKRFSFQFTASSCGPLKCISKGNVEIIDIRVDMAQYSTHLTGRGFNV